MLARPDRVSYSHVALTGFVVALGTGAHALRAAWLMVGDDVHPDNMCLQVEYLYLMYSPSTRTNTEENKVAARYGGARWIP